MEVLRLALISQIKAIDFIMQNCCAIPFHLLLCKKSWKSLVLPELPNVVTQRASGLASVCLPPLSKWIQISVDSPQVEDGFGEASAWRRPR